MSTPKFNLVKNGKIVQGDLSHKKAEKIFNRTKKEDREGLSIARADVPAEPKKKAPSKKKAAADKKAADKKAAAEKAAAEKAAAEKAAAEKAAAEKAAAEKAAADAKNNEGDQ